MFKFALCALDVRTHACDVVAQSGLLSIGEAADQQPFDPVTIHLEISDDRVRLVGQDDALAARVMLHRFTGDQALLLHQGQHTRGGGPGDAELYATIHDKETHRQQLYIQQSACCSISGSSDFGV